MIYFLSFIIVIGLPVFLHELGHFMAARSVGIKVEKFYVGFNLFGLGLPKYELDSFKAYRMRKYPTLSEKTRDKLSNFFRQYNEQLYQLLGRNFDWK